MRSLPRRRKHLSFNSQSGSGDGNKERQRHLPASSGRSEVRALETRNKHLKQENGQVEVPDSVEDHRSKSKNR